MTGPCHCLFADVLNGVHQPGDEYRLALYRSRDASVGMDSDDYTSEGEVSGRGYPSGGIRLTGRTVERGGASASLIFDGPKIANVTVSGVDQGLVYNKTKGRALACLTFDPTSATNGPLSGPEIRITLGRTD